MSATALTAVDVFPRNGDVGVVDPSPRGSVYAPRFNGDLSYQPSAAASGAVLNWFVTTSATPCVSEITPGRQLPAGSWSPASAVGAHDRRGGGHGREAGVRLQQGAGRRPGRGRLPHGDVHDHERAHHHGRGRPCPGHRPRHRRPRLELVRLLPDVRVRVAAGRAAGADQGRRHPDRRPAADHQGRHRTGGAVRADQLRRRRRVHGRRRGRRPRRQRDRSPSRARTATRRASTASRRERSARPSSTARPARTASRPAR